MILALFSITLWNSALAAMDVQLTKFDRKKSRILITTDDAEGAMIAVGDEKFLTNGKQYTRVEVLRIPKNSQFLLHCLNNSKCTRIIKSRNIQLVDIEDTPTAIKLERTAQEIFKSPEPHKLSDKSFDEIGLYISSELDHEDPHNKRIMNRYRELELEQNTGRIIAYPMIGAGLLGLAVVSLATPDNQSQDMRTDAQKTKRIKLGLGSIALSLGGLGILSASSPNDEELSELVDMISTRELGNNSRSSSSFWSFDTKIDPQLGSMSFALSYEF